MESERLILKPLSYNELVQINNNEIYSADTIIEPEAILEITRMAVSLKIEKMQKVCENDHVWYTYWLIINKENGKGIGFIGFKGLPDENGYVEVGYSISPNYRNKRLMTEALKVLVKWAEGFDDCKAILAKVEKTNVGSVKVLNNCNFAIYSSTEQEDRYILKLR